jgi:hypothetical protein
MRSSVRSRRTPRLLHAVLVLALLTAVATAAGPALAQAPRQPEHTSDSGTFVDPDLSEICGAPITVTFTTRETTIYFEEGSEYPHQHLIDFRATISGPGGFLIERDNFRVYHTEDARTFTGKPVQLLSPDGGVVLRDAGYVKFFEDGTEIVHGPHPGGTGEFDFQLICSHLV